MWSHQETKVDLNNVFVSHYSERTETIHAINSEFSTHQYGQIIFVLKSFYGSTLHKCKDKIFVLNPKIIHPVLDFDKDLLSEPRIFFYCLKYYSQIVHTDFLFLKLDHLFFVNDWLFLTW
jgi:hypothetical protein